MLVTYLLGLSLHSWAAFSLKFLVQVWTSSFSITYSRLPHINWMWQNRPFERDITAVGCLRKKEVKRRFLNGPILCAAQKNIIGRFPDSFIHHFTSKDSCGNFLKKMLLEQLILWRALKISSSTGISAATLCTGQHVKLHSKQTAASSATFSSFSATEPVSWVCRAL